MNHVIGKTLTCSPSIFQIKAIIQSGIDVPGNDNDLKKLQLQQLAELNGTFKPLDILRYADCITTLHLYTTFQHVGFNSSTWDSTAACVCYVHVHVPVDWK